jgi:hypothetical protein
VELLVAGVLLELLVAVLLDEVEELLDEVEELPQLSFELLVEEAAGVLLVVPVVEPE